MALSPAAKRLKNLKKGKKSDKPEMEEKDEKSMDMAKKEKPGGEMSEDEMTAALEDIGLVVNRC